MTNLLKKETELLGDKLIEIIGKASSEIRVIVKQAANDMNDQRFLTTQDVQTLIVFAAEVFNQKIQEIISRLKPTILVSALLIGLSVGAGIGVGIVTMASYLR